MQDADIIIDQSKTDNDTANLTVNAIYTPSNITNIENINLDWNATGIATYNLAGVKGAKAITLTSERLGYQGNATVTNINDATLVAGKGTTGTLTASGFKTGTVEGGVAKKLVVNGTATNANNASITVNAGENTTDVTVGTTNGFKEANINAGKATTITIADAGKATDVTNLTVDADATITNTGTGKVNLTANDGNSVTMNVIGEALDVAGSGDITLNSTGLTGEKVTNSVDGTLTVVSSATTAQDVSKVEADLFRFTGNVAAALTFASGANVEMTQAGTLTLAEIKGSAAVDESVNLKITSKTVTDLKVDATLETLNLTADAERITGADLTVTTTTLNDNKLVVSGTNDVSLGAVTNAGTIDASALDGEFTLVQTGTADKLEVTGSATGKNTATFTATTANTDYYGGEGEDNVTLATTTGEATLVLGNGKNTVAATALDTGTLVVVGGDGVDKVTANALTTGEVTLRLGNGNNEAILGGTLAGATIDVETGSGNDKISLTSATHADDNIILNLGSGTNTLVLNSATGSTTDYSAGTWDVTGLTAIQIAGHASGGSTTVAASLVSGKTLDVSAATTHASNVLAVKGTKGAAGETIDLSGLKLSDSISSYLAQTSITGNTGNDIIIGTDGADTITAGTGTNTITGGKGADTFVGGAGTDTYVINKGDTGKTVGTIDIITTAFTSGTDKIKWGLDGTATNYWEGQATGAGSGTAGVLSLADVLIQANLKLDGTIRYVVMDNYNATNSSGGGSSVAADVVYAFFDRDGDGSADEVIQLVGADATAYAFGDFIA